MSEEALPHSEKLAAVGRLDSVLSHESTNKLEAATNLLHIVRAEDAIQNTFERRKTAVPVGELSTALTEELFVGTIKIGRDFFFEVGLVSQF